MTVELPASGDPLRIDVLRGAASEEELAALMGVLSEAYAQEAAAALADEPVARSAWEVSQRALRQPLRRELGWTRGG